MISRSFSMLFRPIARFSELAKFQNSFLTTTNVAYIEYLH
jgi:hypothetical protein